MSYILAIAIGPVQDFIAAARKTRDLYFGSKLLSEVSRKVAKSLPTSTQLIFPMQQSVDDPQATVANKIVAIVDCDEMTPIVNASHEAARALLREYHEITLTQLRSEGCVDDIHHYLFTAQLAQFLEFYAAWWPISDSYSYNKAYAKVNLLLAGRKALRDFSPASGVDGLPKSSLDAGRESVLKGELLKNGSLRLGIKANEQLDGISLMKRIADLERFVSVSRVAIDPFVRRLQQDDPNMLIRLCEKAKALDGSNLAQSFKGYSHYQAFPYDSHLFYGEESLEVELPKDKINCATEFYQEVAKYRKQFGIIEPTPYCAVLVGDGDHMGAVISSHHTPEEHQQLSRRLCEFARRAKSIVSAKHGALVYSGGDDVLAFLPLDMALSCADDLRLAFHDLLGDFTITNAKGEMVTPTFSCGVSIAHYSEHLQHLLKWGRRAERAAKEAGRNRLAVHLHTRTAGEECVSAVHCWKDSPVEKRWKRWVQLLNLDILPDGAAFELRALVREFRGLDEVATMLPKEAERILKRKKGGHGKMALSDKENKPILDELLNAMGTTLDALDSFVNEILIARQFARATALADEQGGTR